MGAAGEYKLKCRAAGSGPSNRAASLPESNELSIELADGVLNEPKGAFLRLQKLFPPEKKWEITMRSGAIYITHLASNLKSDATTIQVWFAEEKLADDFQLGKNDQAQEVNYLGQHKLGHAYVAALPRAKRLAPDYVEMVSGAITAVKSDDPKALPLEINPDLLAPDEGKLSATEKLSPWSVRGHVTASEGQPIKGAEVRVHCGVGTLRQTGLATTDDDGHYSIAFGPGIFMADEINLQAATVSVHLAGHFEKNLGRQGDLLAAMKLPEGENEWGKKPGDIFLPDKPKEVDFTMLPAASVRGVILNVSGHHLDGARVSLTGEDLPPSSSVVAQTRTDKRGRFEISNIPTNFPFQILIEPAKAEPPWLAWAGPPIYFELAKDDRQLFRIMGRAISMKELEIQLHGDGVNWRDALENARNFEQQAWEEFTKETERRTREGKPQFFEPNPNPNSDSYIRETNALGLGFTDKAWGFYTIRK